MNDEKYMLLALKEAEKSIKSLDVPVGAIIVKNNKIIAKSHNMRIKKNDATMHAEINAISKASRKLGDWRLEGCTIYVTLEPCQMCAGAIVQSRIGRLVYGAENEKSGSVKSIIDILDNDKFNHKVEIKSGVLKEECSEIITSFFNMLRIKKRNKKNFREKISNALKRIQN